MKPGKNPSRPYSPIIQDEERESDLAQSGEKDKLVKFTDLTGHSAQNAREAGGRWYGLWQPASASFPRRVPGSGWIATASHLRRTVESVVDVARQSESQQSWKKKS